MAREKDLGKIKVDFCPEQKKLPQQELSGDVTKLTELFNTRLANSVMKTGGMELSSGWYLYQYDKVGKSGKGIEERWGIDDTLKKDGIVNIQRLKRRPSQTDKKQIEEIEEIVFISTGKNPSCIYTIDDPNELAVKKMSLFSPRHGVSFENTKFAINKSREVINAIPQIKGPKVPSRQ